MRRFRSDRAKEAIPWLAADDEPVPIEEPPPIAVEVEVDAEIRELAATG